MEKKADLIDFLFSSEEMLINFWKKNTGDKNTLIYISWNVVWYHSVEGRLETIEKHEGERCYCHLFFEP